ncbi:hypothetical protein KK141_08045 [Dyella sp. LX-66]|uniref:hypothetical protein n=1 Tax=unclassified Dyella TaxID=2634549 RepID=UPI001BDFCF31|nr:MULTISPECIES: hypothetical protein [unclassified Dyella]MBT2115666.1 hypothetical protein [Dyella sp. LX-1]MBT2139481.1 hypothetical protein [Dyella sp. LX-66]
MNQFIKRTAVLFGTCLGMALSLGAHAWEGPVFQAGVDRRVIESSGLDSAWLFTRPIVSSEPPPYVIYRNEQLAGFRPGDSFPARIDMEYVGTANFLVRWEETTQVSQTSFRSLHGDIRSQAPDGRKLGMFRFTMRQGGSELTGCVQLQDRSYCFVGKNGVGWITS